MRITIENMHKEFNGEWVYMINCDEDANGDIISGEVIAHDKNRAALFKKISEYTGEKKRTYIRYAGNLPDEIDVLL